MEFRLVNQPSEATRLHQALSEFSETEQLAAPIQSAIELALEEHFANILNHGYSDTNSHTIQFVVEHVGDWVRMDIQDDGRAFNPLEHPLPDVNVPIEQRAIGGLGVLMIRKTMDRVEYQREGDQNHLTLWKRFRSR